jgi:hypothetical protein
MTALTTETLDLGDGHPLHAHLGQRVTDIVETKRLDDRCD